MKDERFWDKKTAVAGRDEIKEIQLMRLQQTLKHCYDNNSFYRKRLDDAGLDPENIKDLADLEKLPLTSKEEL